MENKEAPVFVKEIVDFISHFAGTEDTFLHGCCYWFANILYNRFALTESHSFFGEYIVYEPVEGHFLYAVCSDLAKYHYKPNHWHYFDVRGDVTELYCDKSMYTLPYLINNEPNWYAHLMRDCRDFTPIND